MPMPVEVDSRRYIIAYGLHSREEVPPDFGERDVLPEFQAGLFLPRADPDWFGRSAYPPRVLALIPAGLQILPHPASKAHAEFLSWEQLCFIEWGRNLLHAWLRLVGQGFDHTLFYNGRGGKAVDAFMPKLRAHFLGESGSSHKRGADLGDPLDLKFGYLLAHELDAGEAVRASLFRQAVKSSRGTFGFKRDGTVPGDLVAITSSRVLWITDRYGRGYSRYGSIVRYAPLSRIAVLSRDGGGGVLRVHFRCAADAWRIPAGSENWGHVERLIETAQLFEP